MTVYVLLREDQSENGFVDASVVGLFQQLGGRRRRPGIERCRGAQGRRPRVRRPWHRAGLGGVLDDRITSATVVFVFRS